MRYTGFMLPKGRIWAQWRERDKLSAPYRLVSVREDGSDFRVEFNPPPGYGLFRPLVFQGGVAALALPNGSLPDLWGMFNAVPWLNGKLLSRPKDFLAIGHQNISPDGTRLCWAGWKWWTPDFATFTSTPDWKDIRQVGPYGFVEPAWTHDGNLIGVRKIRPDLAHPTILSPSGQTLASWPVLEAHHAYDPEVTKDKGYVVWLRTDRNGLMVAPWAKPEQQRYLVPTSMDLISNPKIVGTNQLITARKLDAFNWGLVEVSIPDGKITPITKVTQGNFEQPFFVAD